MGNVYRRENLSKGKRKKKKKDEHARKRNAIINFRVTPEERELIEARIDLSGLTRSEFFIESCLHQHITVIGNVRTFDEISIRLSRIEAIVNGEIRDEVFTAVDIENFETILELLDDHNHIKNKNKGETNIETE
ncbi:MAG: DUF1778 domain-containing protein [Lachnospiraceae bacterium]|nr:DUF1778 domain-containing protein [Lachnospiraceae bacterium]